MSKLTTEQLLFAHRIGATHCRFEEDGAPCYYKGMGEAGEYMFWSRTSIRWGDSKGWPCGWNRGEVNPIDFTPLYDWIDHDGGERPVRDNGVVEIRVNGRQTSILMSANDVPDWTHVTQFKLAKLSDDWPEQHADAIGQNDNDGEHYAESPETKHSTAHHKRPDGTDLIDDWWDTYPPEVARVLMWEQVRKYMNRLGKKDPIHIEVAKMADYMRRWDKKERELAGVDDKPNTIV